MKTIILFFLFSTTVFAKENLLYTCNIDKEINLEFSLAMKSNPTIRFFRNKATMAQCFYESTFMPKKEIAANVGSDLLWEMKLKNCESYSKKFDELIQLDQEASFRQFPGKKPSYLNILSKPTSIICRPNK